MPINETVEALAAWHPYSQNVTRRACVHHNILDHENGCRSYKCSASAKSSQEGAPIVPWSPTQTVMQVFKQFQEQTHV